MKKTLALAALLLFFSPAARGDGTPAAVHAIVDAARLEGLRWPRFPDYQPILRSLYEARDYEPLWLDGHRPTAQALEAIQVLNTADSRGLDVRDYDVAHLDQIAFEITRDSPPEQRAHFDVALSVAVLRNISDLHIGKVNPKNLKFGFDIGPKKYDLAVLVADAVRDGRIRDVVTQAEPEFTQNQLLKEQLARYQQLARDPSVGPVALATKIEAGDPLEVAPQLGAWLSVLGDLPGGTMIPVATYDGALVEGVKRFQMRHGLEPDGIIGPATAKALTVTAAERVRQIQLALERLRWIPSLDHGRVIFVNIPAFELWTFDAIAPTSGPDLMMNVVVGRAVRNQTPVFAGAMKSVVFAPYWNVPRSIVKGEILPKLARNPGYLVSQNMEVVSGDTVLGTGSAAIERLAAGGARLRQKPGPKNALGRVKFLFPNSNNVYLHDTPSQSLFQRTRRDFAHRCVRVAAPAALAHWVLAPEGWDEARVASALASKTALPVALSKPIPVVISYTTAFARYDGTISFYEDIYRHDPALERALAAGYPYLP